MNVHLRKDYNRNILYGLIQKIKLDICILTETWFLQNTSSKLMEKTFGSDFTWFGRERLNDKYSRGGIGILIRNFGGKTTVVKNYKDIELLWVKLIIGNEIYFIGTIYIPPKSTSTTDFKYTLEQLESDCIIFRKEGKVIVMGDFNSRIGNLDSIIQDNENFYNFKRNVSDHSPIGESYTCGQQLISYF